MRVVRSPISPRLAAKLHEHPGRWVAITRSRLLASGKSVGSVVREAREKGVKNPIVFKVPTGEDTAYFA